MKKTAIAPSNIAFVKYWGQTDPILRLPTNNSISMNLSDLTTTTTVEFSDNYLEDSIEINGETDGKKIMRALAHIDKIRALAKITTRIKMVSVNNFPTGTGLSSSASGFAALTVAAAHAAGLSMSEKELSCLARVASGSACRSIPGGFVEWEKGMSESTSYAKTLFSPSHWDIVDIVVCLDSSEKYIPTSNAQYCALTSPFFKTRLQFIDKKIALCKQYIAQKNFDSFGLLVENEALELHAIMMTSSPSLLYLYPKTVALMRRIQEWREGGVKVYFTLNTGHNVHVLCERHQIEKIKKLLVQHGYKKNIVNIPAGGTILSEKHLF